jgi:hypothetical protein
VKDDDDSAMQRFEDLAKRMFSIAKEDIAKVEEIAEDITGPPPAGAPAVDEND